MRSSIQNLIPYDPGLTQEQLEEKLGKTILKLSANESLWGPSPLVTDILQKSVTKLNFYPDGIAQELKKALSSSWNLPAENFCLGNGTDELIFMLATAFLNPGEEVVIPTPTFSSYASSVTIVGGKVTLVPQKDLTFNLKEIARFIHPGVKIVFLCNPNNPTGTFFSHAELELFLKKVPPKTLVVLDEAYGHYATDDRFPRSRELLKKYSNLIILRTFSKVYSLASLRVGYAVAAPQVIKELEKIRQPYNVNTIAQMAATAALQDEKYLQKVIKETVREREWLTQELRQKGLTVLPSQSNFLLVRINNASLVSEKLLQEGILVRNTTSFGLPDWLRITLAPHQYMEQFVQYLEKILLTV
ncbi:MAG: histidinol-phosphate transaminase [Clostridia bacterium]|nr:histidinol-phosphate transaminase [Clostridia bacterium]